MTQSTRTKLPDYALQQIEWRRRSLVWFLDRIPVADRLSAIEMFRASLDQANADGFNEARRLVREIADSFPGSAHIAAVASAVDHLAELNYGRAAL